MSDHTSRQFDQELESVRARVLEMGGMVEQQIRNAIDGLARADREILLNVMNTDHRVNTLEVQVDEECQHIIARRQPAAVDMRMVFTVIKTITDLERIGDEAVKIARMANNLLDANRIQVPRFNEIKHAAEVAIDMLTKALDSFARLDAVLAASVVKEDIQLDAEYQSVVRQLITYMMEDPRTISSSLETITIIKSIERIGDHAKNMSEYVVFMVKGKDIRHLSIADVERAALGEDS
ncbi:phosphate signaling complex protein PhoU [Leeia sp. TBRC 13508]|uniref:Phosphate-specific transport system accessory protein PhoU n=1 Tax=Leeia speluncae TaxID=2884804 RepID=A0ABS8D756_9NEIS|nr:phosphate signaling complex protein PhoU [Leeia speluncae]MCB6184034.1 phosphate signaling complex protein PhoU [Leeia speluncae]